MSAPAIRAEQLGKRYVLGQMEGPYSLLTERLTERFRSMGQPRTPREEFWALRDVEFEVAEGETFGIVGHNGAGKSTLLKLLARITPPSTGRIALRGRVGALLEVGTGFHPELTGRENIFLNGAILGMRKAEIERNFDEIVDFSGVERFIDTPVKRYSSGMQLRLAFSVAAHLEPEILIVDEVLAVGDLAFQEKCLGRIERVAGEGRTVLFVSHNLTAVGNLCDRAMLLSNGHVESQGPTEQILDDYMRLVRTTASRSLSERRDRRGSGELRFTDIGFESDGTSIDSPVTGRPLDIVLTYECAERPPREVEFALSVVTHLGETMLYLSSSLVGTQMSGIPAAGRVRCHIPRCPLPAGQYLVHAISENQRAPIDYVERACEMTVMQGDFFGTGQAPHSRHRAVMVQHQWDLEPIEEAPAPVEAEPVPGRAP